MLTVEESHYSKEGGSLKLLAPCPASTTRQN